MGLRLKTLLLATAVTFALGGVQVPARPLVGAIRWDAWYGLGGASDEIALIPSEWHDRIPSFATISAIGEVKIDLNSQFLMDQEIAYAKAGGLDYWAFDYLGDLDPMSSALHKYLASSHKADMKFALTILVEAVQAADWPTSEVQRFQDPQYVKVLGGRPLVYLYADPSINPGQIATLRSATMAAGLPNPYIVLMTWDVHDSLLSALGLDAISTYALAPTGAVDSVQPYSALATVNQQFWDNAKALSLHVVPLVSTGWDPRPRYYYPPPWGVGAHTAVANGSPSEIAQNLTSAVNWVAANPFESESNTIIMYAWNEFSEGGWLHPLISEGSARLDAIRQALSGVPPTDTMPPVVFISSPGQSAYVRNVVTLTVAATDDVGVRYVQFALDGVDLGQAVMTPPFSVNWNTSGSADGAHVLYALAVDAAGNAAASKPMVVHVTNGSPVPNLAPVVHAGNDQAVTLPWSASLGSVVLDDGLPSNTLTTTWSMASGPGTVSFASPASLATTASFSAAGVYTLRLSAADGSLTRTDDVVITVNPDVIPPAAAITAPLNNATVSGSAVPINANASDPSGIARVEFSADSSLVGTDTTSPYSVPWNTTALSHNSNHTLTAKAFDRFGNLGISTVSVKVGDVTAPAVAITSPLDKAVVTKNANVTISATASDISGVSKVEFYVNSKLTCTDTASPYSCAWKVPDVGKATYILQGKAYDVANNARTAAVTVTTK